MIHDWEIRKHNTSPMIGSLGQLGARSLGLNSIETEVSATVQCDQCGSGQIEASGTVTGDVDKVTISGAACNVCDKTFTLEWDARVTFNPDKDATVGGVTVT